jgi:predicted DNA-binding antitoxin AbrB/MazE fold protein
MSKAIECIYENNVLKPVGKVPLREGERIRVTIKKKLTFEPIQLKKKPTSADIAISGRSQGYLPEYFVHHPAYH